MRTGLAILIALFVTALFSPMPASEPEIPTVAPALRPVALEVEPQEPGEAGEPAEPTAQTRPRRLSLVLTGDVLLHEGLWATARADAAAGGRAGLDFRPLLAPMRPTVDAADLAVCHLETSLAPPAGPFSAYPTFSAPPQIAPALRCAGYDACTTASNHTVDTGFEGVVRTVEALDRAGLAHTGSYATRRDSRRPTLVSADAGDGREVMVGLVSATYGLNGLPVPAEAPWSVDLIDVATIEARAHAARQAGADVVLVALHWGTDGYASVTDEQRRVAGLLTRSSHIDLVYGHHAHVVQPFEKVNGTWVLYGLGNAIAQQDSARPDLWQGVAAQVLFREKPDGRFDVVRVGARPTLVTPYGARPMRYLDVGRALADPHWVDLRVRLLAARRDVLARVGLPGRL